MYFYKFFSKEFIFFLKSGQICKQICVWVGFVASMKLKFKKKKNQDHGGVDCLILVSLVHLV